ncbi:tyrosine-type recombinase/integrase [Limnoglobus roseus]|uniref:tyrosine-type recombinase/integrase n=1 Tax=Limnoglobus roseus TaxID=2598579 RepID=UPI0011EA81DF|nr:tyrosine-type recombinase/integrase [Limnoglobus roseus]
MASVTTEANGNRVVQFVGADKKRRSVRLGAVPMKVANAIKLKVEHLNALAITKLPMDTETVVWVGSIGDDLAAKLAAVGLIPERQSATLSQFLREYVERNSHDWSAGTRTQVRQRCGNLIEAFGPHRGLRSITANDAEELKQAMQAKGLADTTIHRRVRAYRNYFADAVRLKLITANPFAEVRCREGDNAKRKQYIPVDAVLRVMDEANPCWRTIVALARFAGLRTPSETLMLRWDCVNLATGRMVVDSTKTGDRMMPITATLRPYLEEAFDLAPPGTVYVVFGPQADHYRATSNTDRGWINTNVRTTFLKLVHRAGLEQWARPFHNLRASCETDLNAEFPAHVVAKWMGHSVAVAEKHYLQVRDADIDRANAFQLPSNKAVQNPVQSGAETRGRELTAEPKRSEKPLENQLLSAFDQYCSDVQITRQGFEP